MAQNVTAENLDSVIPEYLELVEQPPSAEKKEQQEELEEALNQYFWDQVDQILEDSFDEFEQKASFNSRDAIILNTGLINEVLIARYADDLLTNFSRHTLTDIPERVYFFADFLMDKFHHLITSSQIDSAKTEEEKNITLRNLIRHRNEIYSKLRPMLSRLPGMNTGMVETVCSGKIDDQVDILNLSLIDNPIARTRDQRSRLFTLRQTIFNRLQQSNEAGAAAEYLDRIRMVSRKIYSERKIAHYESELEGALRHRIYERRLSRRDVTAYFKKEIRLVKANLNLGAMGAGLTRVNSFMVQIPEIATRQEVLKLAEKVSECDFHFPELPNILIAPYQGSGFFEWDTDTVYIPVAPDNLPETVVGGLGTYRLTMDLRNSNSNLRGVYEQEVTGENFRDNFLKDYTAWVLNYGFGNREGLDDTRFKFFKKHLCPPLDDVIVPDQMKVLSGHQEKELYDRSSSLIRTGSQDPEDYHTLMILLIRQERPDAALKLVLQATDIFPNNGFLMLNLALLYRWHLEDLDKALKVLSFVIMKDPESIWRILAEDLLEEWG